MTGPTLLIPMCVLLWYCAMCHNSYSSLSPALLPLCPSFGSWKFTVHWPPCISHVHSNALTPSFPNKQFITTFSCLVCVTIQHLVLTWAYENRLPKSVGIASKSRANAKFCIWLFSFVWMWGTIIWLLISVCFEKLLVNSLLTLMNFLSHFPKWLVQIFGKIIKLIA